MAQQKLLTLKENLYWLYSNLAMAVDAANRHIQKYDRKSFMIRSALYRDLMNGRRSPRSFYDDEAIKLKFGTRCVYCGSETATSVDHIFPRKRGLDDNANNLVFSCQACNSSKGAKDMLMWNVERGHFPPLLILQRYLKLAMQFSADHGLMDKDVAEIEASELPFDVKIFQIPFPAPSAFNGEEAMFSPSMI